MEPGTCSTSSTQHASSHASGHCSPTHRYSRLRPSLLLAYHHARMREPSRSQSRRRGLSRRTSSDSAALARASTTALAGEGRAAAIACASVVGVELHMHPDVGVCSIGHDELTVVLLLRRQRWHATRLAPGLWSGRVRAGTELAATGDRFARAKRQPPIEDCDVGPRDCMPMQGRVRADSRSTAEQTATTAVGLEPGSHDGLDGTIGFDGKHSRTDHQLP